MSVAARSKAWFCGTSLVEIAGSNPAGVMDISCECCMFCQVEVSVRRADHLSREALPTMCLCLCLCVCLCLIEKPRLGGGPA